VIRRTVQSISFLKLGIIFFLSGFIIFSILVIVGVIPFSFLKSKNENVPVSSEKLGSCLILDQKSCDMLRLVDSPMYPGEKIAFAKLPVGTKIYAPENGKVEMGNNFVVSSKRDGKNVYETGYNFIVNSAQYQRPDKLYSIIFFMNPDTKISKTVQSGEIIGQINLDNLLSVKDYNFAFVLSKFSDVDKKYINTTQEIINK